MPDIVTPTKVGVQGQHARWCQGALDSGLRRNDEEKTRTARQN